VSLRPAGMDASFRRVVNTLPEPLRRFSDTLPHRLGLTRWPDGGFEDFWVLDINRDLPGYVVSDLRGVSFEALDCFRRAHHCAAIYGLIHDRIEDRQVEPDPRLNRLAKVFRKAWEDQLAEATDRPRARAAITRALNSLRRGTRMEQRALAGRQLSLVDYVVQTREKLRWGGATTRSMVELTGDPRRASLLERSYDYFCLALQCIDDALDSADDVRRQGVCAPDLLGLSPSVLVRTTPVLISTALQLARQAELHRLAAWLQRYLRFCEQLEPDGNAKEDMLLARRVAVVAQEHL
jgi:hypothetical protein